MQIILLAGWAQPLSQFEDLAQLLESRGFAVECVSLAELSRRNEDGTLLGNLLALLADYDEPPLVVGWSMGGMLALQAAESRQDLLCGMVLLASTASFVARDAYEIGMTYAEAKRDFASMRANYSASLKSFFSASYMPHRISKKEREEMLSYALSLEVEELDRGLDYLLNTDLRDALVELSLPILLVHGKEDRIIPFRASEFLKNNLPSCRMHVLDTAGHMLVVSHAAEISEQIAKFVDDVFE